MSSESKLIFLQPYLACNLQERGFDSEIYSAHLLTLLDEDLLQPSAALEDFLNDCSFNEEDLLFLAQKWRDLAKRGSLAEEDLEYIHKFEESLLPIPPAPSSSSPPTSNKVESWDEEEPEESDDLDMYYSEVDWLSVIEGVEETLRTNYKWTQAEFSPEALFYALAMSGNHVEYAAQLLINGAQVLESCKPCRHLMKSKCLRKDCHFDHNLIEFPCRYWLFSQCANASATDDPSTTGGRTICPFMHGLPATDWIEPACSSVPHNTSDHSESLLDAFPALSDEVSGKTSQQSRGYLAAVKSATSSSSSSAFSTVSKPPSASSPAYNSGKSVPKDVGFADILRSHNFVAGHRNSSKFSTNGLTASDWVESGDVVRQDYETLRKEAREYAVGRNKFLQEATLAYMHGNRSSAKSLSRQGQQMNDKMKDYHIMAAKAIFRKRNPIRDLLEGKIDLHGLHVSEARDCLYELLPLYQKHRFAKIRVITGTGHHTKGPSEGNSRLNPSVRELLEYEYGLKFEDIRDQQGYSGGFSVHLTS